MAAQVAGRRRHFAGWAVRGVLSPAAAVALQITADSDLFLANEQL